MQDLHLLPKLADSLTYLYAEHAIVEQKQKAIEIFDQDGATLVPTAALTVLLLGPGTRITHAAVKALADCGCAIVWVGEDGTRCYANGGGETRRAYHLLHQARLASDERLRLEVCKRMYRMRFDDPDLDPVLDIQQLRGMEGARVRSAYAQASIRHGVEWHGRSYKRGSWGATDPVNRALSAANALLNGLCHAAIVSGGYSPGLGFIHTGKQRSFVYDIADLYKVEITIPLAFRIAGESPKRVEPRVRAACRQAFKETRLLQRILPDIAHVLDVPQATLAAGAEADSDPARPEPLWSPAAPVDPPAAVAAEPAPVYTTGRDAAIPPGAPASKTPASEMMESEAVASEMPASETMASETTASKTMEPETAASETPEPEVAAAEGDHRHPAPATSASRDTEASEAERALRARRERAEAGLAGDWVVRSIEPDVWHVVTRPGSAGYIIRRTGTRWHCTCPDFAKTGLGACKHTLAVEIKTGD